MVSSIECVTSKVVMSKNITTGIAPENEHEIVLKLYPNPNEGMFTVAADGLSAARHIELEVTNVLGQTIYRQQVFIDQGKINHVISLNKTNAAGAYMLNVIIDGKRLSKRFVIIE